MELLMLGGLLIIVSMLMASSKRALANEEQHGAYVFKGLVLAFFAVGAFSVGRVLLGVMPANTLDIGYMTMGGWMFTVPLMLVFLYGFSRSQKNRLIPHSLPKRSRSFGPIIPTEWRRQARTTTNNVG